ncbi:hypothetical protein MHUMG1_04234 [Metarhizium humberi]|uniref:LSM domain-containing protein n=1 Tax=Metarhizium humberi TaxID=2596975 RepID=A0A9P8MCP5_9HYPO|nr:hypothetical protein MHUMG1_04234 [Metarhizium humberi]
MDKSQAQEYLSSLLNQNLRVHTTDGRLFWGAFKCTDPQTRTSTASPAAPGWWKVRTAPPRRTGRRAIWDSSSSRDTT